MQRAAASPLGSWVKAEEPWVIGQGWPAGGGEEILKPGHNNLCGTLCSNET